MANEGANKNYSKRLLSVHANRHYHIVAGQLVKLTTKYLENETIRCVRREEARRNEDDGDDRGAQCCLLLFIGLAACAI